MGGPGHGVEHVTADVAAVIRSAVNVAAVIMVSVTIGGPGGALVVWPETLSRTPWLINKLAGGPPF